MARLSLPRAVARWRVRDARVPACLMDAPSLVKDRDGLCRVDLVVDGAAIAALGPVDASAPDLPFLDAGGALALPCFVDAHTHLDKGHIAPRAPNPDGSFLGARETVAADRAARWSADDVRARMDFALRCAYAHGTAAIRTHIDSAGAQTRVSWPVFGAIRDAWRDRVDLQASPLFGIEFALDDVHMRDVSEMVGEFGGCLGAVTYPGPALLPGLDRLFRMASDEGWDLDFHADETGDPGVDTLAAIADAAIRFAFPGRILVGHCCSLAVMPGDERRRTIDRVARAGLAIVSLPMCNMYLQDRGAGTPRWRGVTAYKELQAAGVPVSIASDNTRDPFYAYGDLDMAEVLREGTRILQLDHPFGDWAAGAAATPAAVLRRPRLGALGAGAPADFILFRARSWGEWMARPQSDRTVIRRGVPIDAAPPAYDELDALEGLRP